MDSTITKFLYVRLVLNTYFGYIENLKMIDTKMYCTSFIISISVVCPCRNIYCLTFALIDPVAFEYNYYMYIDFKSVYSLSSTVKQTGETLRKK